MGVRLLLLLPQQMKTLRVKDAIHFSPGDTFGRSSRPIFPPTAIPGSRSNGHVSNSRSYSKSSSKPGAKKVGGRDPSSCVPRPQGSGFGVSPPPSASSRSELGPAAWVNSCRTLVSRQDKSPMMIRQNSNNVAGELGSLVAAAASPQRKRDSQTQTPSLMATKRRPRRSGSERRDKESGVATRVPDGKGG